MKVDFYTSYHKVENYKGNPVLAFYDKNGKLFSYGKQKYNLIKRYLDPEFTSTHLYIPSIEMKDEFNNTTLNIPQSCFRLMAMCRKTIDAFTKDIYI